MLAILVSNAIYFLVFRRELAALAAPRAGPDVERPEDDGHARRRRRCCRCRRGSIAVHLLFMAWTVINAHYPALFIGGFLIFLGFAKATAAYQSRVELKAPLLVGFFLGRAGDSRRPAGLVDRAGAGEPGRGAAVLRATLLTAFNDNALITYLATLVPDLSESLKIAVVEGAVTGGGLTVIANAPNPAGQALLGRFFGGAIHPLGCLLGALLPTIVAIIAFRLL